MKIQVIDIKYTFRDVEIPEKCPECKADLLEEGAVRAWEFQNQQRQGTFLRARDRATFSFDETGDVTGGECFIGDGYTDYYCTNCSHTLASGDLSEERAVDVTSALLAWSASSG